MSIACLRPTFRLLSAELIRQILAEARTLLADLGLEVHAERTAGILLAAGASRNGRSGRLTLPPALVDRALGSTPRRIQLYGRDGEPRADLGDDRIHFTPGSAAIRVLDAGHQRAPLTADYVRYARLVDRLPAIDYPSTALIPTDVPEEVADAYRLYLTFLYATGPVVTGAFTAAGFALFRELMIAVRGSPAALAAKPLAVFSCCPTAPLAWSEATAYNVTDCARLGVPIELISMPLTGFVAPGTLVGSLVQHTAETLSGVVLSQVSQPGAPVLWGGSPAIFDYRTETTPMGAIETQMIACAYAEIGKALGLPTQAYIGLSDAKQLDAQAGLESASGAVLAALAGINSISGAGMLDFESCQSLEKLVVDAELCRMAKRLVAGISLRDGEMPSRPHFEQLLADGHSLIADHTRRWFKDEVWFPGPVIDRSNYPRWCEEGSPPLADRAHTEVERLLGEPPRLIDAARRAGLDEIMTHAARAAGLDTLPEHG